MATRKLNKFRSVALALLIIVGMFGFMTLPQSAKAEEPEPIIAVSPITLKTAVMLAATCGDNGWNAAHCRAFYSLKELGKVEVDQTNYFVVVLPSGDRLEVLFVDNIGYDPSQIEKRGRDILQEGYHILFMTWWDTRNPAVALAKEFPDRIIEQCSGYPAITSNGVNLSTYFEEIEQGDCVRGFVAGMMGITKLGVISTFSIPEPVRGLNALKICHEKGLEAVGIDPSKSVVRVVWINSWLDVGQEKTATLTLISAGFEGPDAAIMQWPDTPTVAQTACEEGVVTFGYGTDVTKFGANCAILTDEWNRAPYYKQRVLDALNHMKFGSYWNTHDWWGGLKENAVNLVWGPNVPDDVKQKGEQLAADIKSGKYNFWCGPIHGVGLDSNRNEVAVEVPDGKCVGPMGRLTMQWFVTAIEGQMPEPPGDGVHQLYLEDAK